LTRVIDFDAFRSEQTAEPLELRIGGRVYNLPSSLPASLALDVIRMNAEDATAEFKAEDLMAMGRGIFGGELFDTVLRDNGVTMEELPELFKMVFNAYTGAPEDPNPESLPESVTAGTSSASSATGRSSKRTS
jgi:hypothetical protein